MGEGGGGEGGHLQHHTRCIFILPEAVNNMYFHHVADILIKRSHKEINVMKIVEFPTF